MRLIIVLAFCLNILNGTFSYSQRSFVIDDKEIISRTQSGTASGLGLEELYFPAENTCSSDWIIYYDNNKKDIAAKNGKTKDGNCMTLHYWPNQNLQAKLIYRNEGSIEEYFYKNGQIMGRANRETGKENFFYENGQVYQNHNEYGEFEIFYENGQVWTKGVLKNHKYYGIVSTYDTTGNLIEVEIYSYGDLIYSGEKVPPWYKE